MMGAGLGGSAAGGTGGKGEDENGQVVVCLAPKFHQQNAHRIFPLFFPSSPPSLPPSLPPSQASSPSNKKTSRPCQAVDPRQAEGEEEGEEEEEEDNLSSSSNSNSSNNSSSRRWQVRREGGN